MRKIIVLAVAGLAGLTACSLTACSANRIETPSAEALNLPIAESPDGPASPPPDLTGAAIASSAPTPAPSPTLAKKQRWVKIMSGPSAEDIKPNANKKAGSHTVELNVAENAQVGQFVTDGAGRTLYRFDNDSSKPPKSTCNGDCAAAWPPLLIKSPGQIFPDGIDPKTIGYVERADGHCQVTINGWPVYYFIADAKAGDLNGQGINGKWFAIAPGGGKTKAIPGFPLKN